MFGRSPREAVEAGLVGAMLQTGALIRDLSVRELVTMVASLYPTPLDVDEVLELDGPRGDRRPAHAEALGRRDPARRASRVALVSDPDLLVLDEPTVAMDVEARREFWAAMRAFAARGKTVLFATHYLEEADANADRAVLMAHGRIVADGPTTEIKARVGTRTIRATLPECRLGELAALPGVAAPSAAARPSSLSCSDSDQAIRALLERYPHGARHRDRRRRRSRRRSCAHRRRRAEHGAPAVAREHARSTRASSCCARFATAASSSSRSASRWSSTS